MHLKRKYLFILMSLALGLACYVVLTSWVKINAVTNFKINQMQGAKKDQRFPDIRRVPSESKSVISTSFRKGRSLINTTYNPSEKVFIPNRKHKKLSKKNAEGNLTEKHNNKLYLGGFVRNVSIKSSPTDTKDTQNITAGMDLSLNSYQNKKPCSIALNQSSLASARKTFLDSKGGVLFYVNIDADGMFNSFTKQEQDELLHWEYVLKKEKYLVQLPIDFDLVTYHLIPNDNEEFVLNLEIFYNDSNCEEHFPEALRQVKYLLWNNLFYNASDSFLCNRYFEDQHRREVLYLITTIWVGYDLTCSERRFEDEKFQMYEQIIEKDVLPYFVSWVTFYLSLQFVWIFALLDLNKDPVIPNTINDNSLSFYRKNDHPYGIKRFILKSLYMMCPCTSKQEENTRYCIEPAKRLLLLTWVFILLPFGLYRTVGRYCLSVQFFKAYLEVIRPSEPLCSIIPSDTAAITIDVLIAVFVPLIFVCRGKLLYEAFTNSRSADKITHTKVSDNFVKPLYNMFHSLCSLVTCKCFKPRKCGKCCICFVPCCTGLKYVGNVFTSLLYCLFPIIPFVCNQHSCKCNCREWSCEKCCKNSCNNCKNCCKNCCENCKNCCENCCELILFNLCFIFTLIALRPIISTFTFIFRSFTYFVFVALIIRIHFMRYALLIMSILVYILKYMTEFVSMNVDILNHIIDINTKRSITTQTTSGDDNSVGNTTQTTSGDDNSVGNTTQTTSGDDNSVGNTTQTTSGDDNSVGKTIQITSDDGNSVEKINEEIFDNVYKEISFVKRRLYFLCLKILIVVMYLIITIIIFTKNRDSLIGINFKDNIEVLIFIIGPYAVAFVLKTDKGDYLSEENKIEIKDIYDRKYDRKKNTTVLKDQSSQTEEKETSMI